MGIASDAIRPHWMAGIHAVTAPSQGGFRAWVAGKRYQIYSAIETNRFTLNLADARELTQAYSADISRLAAASLETMHSGDELSNTPKACAWLVIRSYYAAYYASNALCRILGTTVTQLDAEQTRAVHSVADVYGQAVVPGIESGLFECTFENMRTTLLCRKLTGASGGSHELFWGSFLALIRRTGDNVLRDSAIHSRSVAAKLFDLSTNLCLEGRNGGNWLSFVRNEVTYRHGLGTWFPYHSGIRRDELRRTLSRWTGDPMTIDLTSGRPSLGRFAATCAFLVALTHEVLCDVARRCPRGRSFIAMGPQAYLNRVSSCASRD